MPYAELCVRSCFSLLDGASQPEELVSASAEAGIGHLGLVDRDSVYGLVQAHKRASETGVHLVCGATLTVRDRPAVVVLVEDRQGWSNLCRLLTAGRENEQKGRSSLPVPALLEHSGHLTCLLRSGWTREAAGDLREAFGDRLGILLSHDLTPAADRRTAAAQALAEGLGVPLVASNDVRMHHADRKRLSDVLCCVRRKTTLEEVGRASLPNAERRLLSEREFRARYARWPGAVEASISVAERCGFSMAELTYGYPREVVPDGHTPMTWLHELTARGLAERFPHGVPSAVLGQVAYELSVIEELDFPSYFLTVHDIVRFARSQGILCQGRGSAANSAVCYALGITAVDPSRAQLLFERFISKERGEPPDIDVDFEHERREEVIQYIYDRYGRDRAGMVNEFICYRQRSAIRDVGKVFGLSLDQVDRLAKGLDRWSAGIALERAEAALPAEPGGLSEVASGLIREAGLDPDSAAIRSTLEISEQLAGFPRHLSIHVGGFVIADGSLLDLGAHRAGDHGRPNRAPMGQVRRRCPRLRQGGRARSRDLDGDPQVLRPHRVAGGALSGARDGAPGRPCCL